MTRSKKSKKSNNNGKLNKQKVVDENVDPKSKEPINNKILPKICLSCGVLSREIPHECLAKQKICSKCNKKGHYSRVCQFSERQNNDDKCNSSEIDVEDDGNDKCLLEETKMNGKKNTFTDNENKVIDAKTRIHEMKEMANCLYKKQNFTEALALYSTIIAECSDEECHYSNRAACLMMMENYKEALVDAKKSVDMNPTFVKGHIRVAKCLMILGKFIEADLCFNKVFQIDPTNKAIENEKRKLSQVQLCTEIMNQSMADKKYHVALENINDALKISPQSEFFKIKQSECLAYIGKYELAEMIVNEILQVDKTNVDAKFVLSLCLYQSNVSLAMETLVEVLRVVPDHVKAQEIYKKAKALIGKIHAGNVAYNKNNYEKAYSLYNEAVKVDENNLGIAKNLYYKMAKASYKLKNYEQSIENCSEALKICPTCIDVLIHRGDSYIKIREYKKAIEDLSIVMRLNPFLNECRNLLYEAFKLLKSNESVYHDILGVEKSASMDDIRRAYHEKAMLHHPDRHSNASQEQKIINEKKFKEITQAYRKLTEKNSSGLIDGSGYAGYTADYTSFMFTSVIHNFFR